MSTTRGETSQHGGHHDEKTLFSKVMEGDWDEVINDYINEPASHTSKITAFGDTALHVAIANGLDEVAGKLIAAIATKSHGQQGHDLDQGQSKSSTDLKRLTDALKIKNDEGNTPLHSAAALGTKDLCKKIINQVWNEEEEEEEEREGEGSGDRLHRASVAVALVEEKNDAGETPLFLAAQMGNNDSFLFLLSVLRRGKEPGEFHDSGGHKRTDGHTILHCAIDAENFYLAFIIICTFKDLVDAVNTDGHTPLHVLAQKPSAFYSSTKKRLWERIIYKIIQVKELKYDQSCVEGSSPTPENKYCLVKRCSDFIRSCIPLTSTPGHTEAGPELPIAHTPRQAGLASSESKISTGKALVGALHWRSQANDADYNRDNQSGAIFKLVLYKAATLVLSLLGCGTVVMNLREEKEKHTSSFQVMQKLIGNSSTMYRYDNGGGHGHDLEGRDQIVHVFSSEDTPSTKEKVKKHKSSILIAARNGIKEIVEEILKKYPVAVHDIDEDKKNIVLLAVEYRNLNVYNWLLDSSPHQSKTSEDYNSSSKNTVCVPTNAFRRVDINGNSALHLAANLERSGEDPWPISGGALQMQWEIKWKKYVEKSMPVKLFVRYNKEGMTPEQIFTKTHKTLVEQGGKWLNSTGNSCSVVAALIATVSFATSTSIPGGTDDTTGKPNLENQFGFKLFAITSLMALSTSVTSLAMFLAILTSRYLERDFESSLPWKLLIGLSSLFVSIASILISFCAGHFFVLQDTLKYAALPVYAVMCLPVSFFAVAQFPLYFDLVRTTFRSPFGKLGRLTALQ